MRNIHPIVVEVTEAIQKRSKVSRSAYLKDIKSRRPDGFARHRLTPGNQAHASAGCVLMDKTQLLGASWPNIGIVSAYNDMLSAHQPYEDYAKIIRSAARTAGATAQMAGGVPAMCDGVTQGNPGMELSLFSRDVIAMAAGVALSHDTFDAALYLGVCDKIVPGLLMGALHFGHVPAIFIPAGPMPSGLPNKEKARIRQLYAEGKASRAELLKAEAESYHSPGTCTFYGTANSNQMLLEVMGLHLPGAAFVNPNTPLRAELTKAATKRAAEITAQSENYLPIGEIIDERAIVNAIVGLMATGGSTNHTLHIPAIARAAGIEVNWDDFDQLSQITPLLARIYPNGQADVNHFHAAGGMGYLIRQLIEGGLIHADITTVMGNGMQSYTLEPAIENEVVTWRNAPDVSGDPEILRPVSKPFSEDGGLRVLKGNIGRGVIKTSAVKIEHRVVEAPARVFEDQNDLLSAYEAGTLNCDFIAVVRGQGPSANGMPELHKLTPSLGVLQDKGFKVALITDGRMSGASGKVPAAIHLGPEALKGGPISKIQDGDIIRLDAETGELNVLIEVGVFEARTEHKGTSADTVRGYGREMFSIFRKSVTGAEQGACVIETNLPNGNM